MQAGTSERLSFPFIFRLLSLFRQCSEACHSLDTRSPASAPPRSAGDIRRKKNETSQRQLGIFALNLPFFSSFFLFHHIQTTGGPPLPQCSSSCTSTSSCPTFLPRLLLQLFLTDLEVACERFNCGWGILSTAARQKEHESLIMEEILPSFSCGRSHALRKVFKSKGDLIYIHVLFVKSLRNFKS